jgi:hypothetical protein
LGDIGKLKEQPAGMTPTQRGRDRRRLACRIVESVEVAIGEVDLPSTSKQAKFD